MNLTAILKTQDSVATVILNNLIRAMMYLLFGYAGYRGFFGPAFFIWCVLAASMTLVYAKVKGERG